MSLAGMPIPLVARILLSAGTTIFVRMWEFVREEPLLRPMHYDEEQHERAKLELQRQQQQALNLVVQPQQP